MTYRETLAYIYGLARFGMKPGLERISALLDNLGNPHRRIRAVHVAGTNGKGSTAAFLSAIVAAGGYRVGLFTSPHLIHFTERIRINGAEIGEDAVIRLAERILKVAPEGATFFEIVTAMALLHFAEEGVELAVLEAGMGGGLDATNAVSGILSVITPVSLDHCEYLGATVAEIASEKGGVVKPGRPLVLSPQLPEALEVLRTRCTESGSPFYLAGTDFSAYWEGEGLAYRGLQLSLSGLKPGLAGRYQAENAASALCAAELLRGQGFPLDDAALRRGIEEARWPGRMELFGESPRFLLDGAHNAAGSEALAEALADIPRGRLLIVAGVMGDKDAAGILAPLLPLATRVFAVSPNLERAMPSAALATLCHEQGAECIDAGAVAAGLSLAGEAAGPDDLVLVCGSLFTVGEARAVLLAERFEPCRG
ncbi:MAG: bifunctional folylpolyglutamate synthase/dihydrofolate synthase [Geobacteraceae bacterium]|nr:bifunctional folylpolyglutamate synthase/dihydrofolate synthase [Geobacteraceae bacterium]